MLDYPSTPLLIAAVVEQTLRGFKPVLQVVSGLTAIPIAALQATTQRYTSLHLSMTPSIAKT
jgi:hypothetical protein